MGGQISKMMGKIFGSKEMRLLMLGLDAAGKTSKSLHEADHEFANTGHPLESRSFADRLSSRFLIDYC
jgi:hypothetical protein